MSHAKKQSYQYIHRFAVRVMFTLYLKIKQNLSTKSIDVTPTDVKIIISHHHHHSSPSKIRNIIVRRMDIQEEFYKLRFGTELRVLLCLLACLLVHECRIRR